MDHSQIAIVGDKSDKYLEEKAGYFGEKIVLFAQKNGLNTCWVALTYKKSAVPIELKENEKLVIIAIGYGENQGSFHRTKKYDEISKTSEKDSPDWYKRGVEYAMLAPTAFNQQKFQLELTNEKKDGKSVVKITSKLGLYIRIDKGIAIYHFELGAGKNNFEWSENI